LQIPLGLLLVFAILAQSTLASVNNEKDNIVPESKDNEPVEFTNKIMRGLEFLATKVAKQHHVSKAQAEAAVQVESDVDDSMLIATAAATTTTATSQHYYNTDATTSPMLHQCLDNMQSFPTVGTAAVAAASEVETENAPVGQHEGQITIDYCSDWCGTEGKWGCGVETDPNFIGIGIGFIGYTCCCSGCNKCKVSQGTLMCTLPGQ